MPALKRCKKPECAKAGEGEGKMDRRRFMAQGLKGLGLIGASAGAAAVLGPVAARAASAPKSKETQYDWTEHYYSFIVDTYKCIGCGMCVRACKRENGVPDHFFRTWVERYIIAPDGEAKIDSPTGGLNGFRREEVLISSSKAFFVPKLCNHCRNTPCVQVCPVGASYHTVDGLVLVDAGHCIGCGYCVQACPYGSRFINPGTHTADKCTWCYHRLTKGLKTACVQACPAGARMIGDIKNLEDPVRKILATRRIQVLKPELLTEPHTYYLGMDKAVR